MRLELEATPQEVMRAVEALQDFGHAEQVPERVLHGLALALEECGCNIITHALGRDARKKFQVAVERQVGRILIELRDSGPEFDLTGFNVPAPAPDDDVCGGWGIQLVRRYTDAIRYRREGNENVLLLIKKFDEPSTAEIKSERDETIQKEK
jgi:sigma-B regulation protein RsbU (phosphoserine phosphatase)